MPDGTSNRTDPAYRIPPHNEEAEQALLGAILVNNRAHDKVLDFLRPEHFFDPVHARIFKAADILINRGQLANPVTLKAYFANDAEYAEWTDGEYLARLCAAIITVHNAEDYGRAIHDTYLRRQLIEIAEQVVANAYRHDLDVAAGELLSDAESALFTLGETGSAAGDLTHIGDAAMEAVQATEAAIQAGGKISGATTGLRDLDDLLGGMQPGDLVIVGGRPSMGKTAFAINTLARANALAGTPALVFSLEMSKKQLSQRQLAAMTGISTIDQRRGRVDRAQFQTLLDAQLELRALDIMIDDRPGLTVAQFRQRVRRAKRKRRVGLVVVDYLQMMRGPPEMERTGNKVAITTEVSRGLKEVAKELEVPVVALSQLSRKVEERDDHRPQLADLRESGAIEQDADTVIFIYRDEYYLERNKPKQRPGEDQEKYAGRLKGHADAMMREMNMADFIVPKSRHGEVGTKRAHWSGPKQQFSDLYQQRSEYE